MHEAAEGVSMLRDGMILLGFGRLGISVEWLDDRRLRVPPEQDLRIVSDEGGEDVFCHHSSIVMDGYRTIDEGRRVEFEMSQGPKGLQAQNVRPIA